MLYGSHGVGKSSVLRAGVAYHLQQKAKQNLEDYGTPEFAVIVFNYWIDDLLAGLIKQIETDINKLYQEVKGVTLETVPKSSKLDKTLQAWTEPAASNDSPMGKGNG